jgi:diguanylate cyclase (GGDEF)-like protein
VLKLVADVLLKSVRFEDFVCRHGGEEMLVLLPEADAAAVAQRAEDIRRRVAALTPVYRDVPLGAITVSIGTAVFPVHGETRERLIRTADAALYEAKRTGRDRVVAAVVATADPATTS